MPRRRRRRLIGPAPATCLACGWISRFPNSLVVALCVIVGNEVTNGCLQRLLAEQEHALQTQFLDILHDHRSIRPM